MFFRLREMLQLQLHNFILNVLCYFIFYQLQFLPDSLKSSSSYSVIHRALTSHPQSSIHPNSRISISLQGISSIYSHSLIPFAYLYYIYLILFSMHCVTYGFISESYQQAIFSFIFIFFIITLISVLTNRLPLVRMAARLISSQMRQCPTNYTHFLFTEFMGRIRIIHLFLVSLFIIILLSHLAYFAHYLSLTMMRMNPILLSLSLAHFYCVVVKLLIFFIFQVDE